MAQPMKLSILIGADASGAKAGGAEAQQALEGVRSAANDAGQSINQLIAAQTGLNRAFSDQQMRGQDIQAYAAQLDALRARYNPLFGAVSRYKSEVLAIRQAHAVGAISSGEMTAAIGRERQATLASIDAIKGRNAALRSMSANNNVGSFQTANIAAQFQDIGVSAAMGMSPLQIALQQGTQLSMVFEQMRASGMSAGAGLLSAFTSIISPISLVTIGVTAAAAAAFQYFTSTSAQVKSVDELLDAHRENIKALGEAYGVATDKALTFSKADREVATAAVEGSAAEVKTKLAQEIQEMRNQFGNMVTPGRSGNSYFKFAADFQPFAAAFEKLRKDADIEGFVEEVNRIGEASPAYEQFAQKILLAAKNSLDLNNELAKTSRVLQTIGGASQRGFLANDQRAQADYSEAVTDAYLREKAAIDEIYKSGVTTRGFMVTSAQQLLNYENALTDTYKRQNEEMAKGASQRGFIATDAKAQLDYENGVTDAYLRQQQTADKARQALALYDAQRQQSLARSPQEKADAARALAAAQVDPNEPEELRRQRIDLAGKAALSSALRDLKQAQDDRARSLQSSIDAQQLELDLVGKSAAEQARLRMEYKLTADLKEQAARTGTDVDRNELELIRQKAAEYGRLQQAISAQNILKQQTDDIDRLRLEISLVGASAETRARSIAAYEAEKQIRDQGINSLGQEAAAIRANAQERAGLQLQLERQQAAYQSVQQAGSTMIDQLTVGTGSLKDRLKSMADTLLTTFQQLAVANPLKNMLLGTNLPTLGDLFSGKPASPIGATSTASMTVTAGTVMINGAPLGLPGVGNPFAGATATVPGATSTTNPVAGATATVSRILPAANQNTTPVGGALGFVGNYQQGVDPRMTDILREAALRTPGYKVDAFSGYRPGDPRFHGQGLATDVRLTDLKTGQALGNYQDPATFRQYEQFAQTARQVQMEKYPELNDQFRWGGYFGGPAGRYGAMDQMHFDLGGSNRLGMAGGTWENGLNSTQRNFFPGAQSQGMNAIEKVSPAFERMGQSVTTTTNSLNTFGTGALDASKALQGGATSITGSVNTLATQTAQVPAQSQGLFSSLFSSIGKGISGIGGLFSSIFGALFADGAAFNGGVVVPFATGGVVSGPTLFPMAGGRTGVMGEAGPEAIMPLRRGADGRLGVTMAMPRQMREGRAEMRLNLASSHSITVQGMGDRELMDRMHVGMEEMLAIRDDNLRASLPDLIEQYRRNPWARTG